MTSSQLAQIHEILLTKLDRRFTDMQSAPSEGKIRSLKSDVNATRSLVEQLLGSTSSNEDLLQLQELQQDLIEQLQQTVNGI